jgi:hypothetical protein
VIIQAGFGSTGKQGDLDTGKGGNFDKTVNAGDNLTLKFRVPVGIGLSFDNKNDSKIGGNETDNPTDTSFGFNLGLKAGIEFKVHPKFNL